MGKSGSAPSKKTSRNPAVPPVASESQRVEALTIGWVLHIVMTFLLDLAMGATRWYLQQVDPRAESIIALHFLTFISGLVAATICLVLTFFTVKLRKEKPPVNVTRFAIIVSLVPFIVAAYNFFGSR